MKIIRLFPGLLIVAAMFCGGCGNSSIIPVGRGNMEGYVYTKNYNSAIADQESLRVAGRDAPTGYAAVRNAKVELVGETRNPVYTDSDGKFFFRDIEAKEYTVRASKDDMEALTFKVTVPTDATVVANDIAGNSSMSMTPSVTGTLTVTATADCAAPVPVQGTVYINSKQTTYQTPLAVIMDIMPGDYTVYVKADNYQKSNELPVTITEGEQVSADFQLVSDGGNATPYAVINTPTDGGSAAQGTLIAFTGEAGDCEDGVLTGDSLVWTSSIDKNLGTGVSLNTSGLSVGQHTIMLKATDSGGLSGSDSITFTITPNTAPAASILLPLNNSSFKNGAVVTFAGTGADTEDGTLAGDSLVWTSNLDDEIGTGNSFQKNNLSVGAHTITLKVTDSAGLTGSKSVKITVESEPAPNTPPIAAIIWPTDGSQYDAGAAVPFAGTGFDAQDVALTGGSLVWTYENGSLGTGTNFSLSNLPAGEHVITLTATDSGGMVDTASVTITIVSDDALPVAAILLPLGGTEFPLGATVTFTGTGIDAEDGNLTEDSLVWTSSHEDDEIGRGVTFEKSDLTPGEHIITLTVIDSADQTDTATVTITVSDEPSQNTAPVAVIIFPRDNASRAAGTTINFYGGAVDAEDVTIPNNKMIWISDKDGQIGEGPNFSANDLSVNVHTITFTAIDSEGLSGSDSITLTITE